MSESSSFSTASCANGMSLSSADTVPPHPAIDAVIDAWLAEPWADLFDRSKMLLCTLDTTGHLVEFSASWSSILGWSAAELTAEPFWLRVHPDDRPAMQAAWERLSQEGTALSGLTHRCACANGSYRWLEWHASWDASRGLICAVVRETTDRQNTEEQLTDAQQRLNTILANMPTIVYAIDPDGCFSFSEGQGLAILGLQPGEVVGQSIFDLYGDYPEICQNIQAVLAGEKRRWEAHVADHIFDSLAVPTYDAQGRLTGLVGVSTDVTTIWRTERDHQRLIEILDATPDLVAVADVTGRLTYLNPAGRRMLGAPATGDIPHLRFFDFLPPVACERFRQADQDQLLREGLWRGENTLIHGDGRDIPVSQVALVHEDEDDPEKIGFLSTIARDISPQRQAQEALRASMERFQTIVGNIPGAVYRCLDDPDWSAIFMSQAIADIAGYLPQDFIQNRTRSLRSIVDPEDIERVMTAVRAAIQHCQPFAVEYRLHHQDGSTRWVSSTGRGAFDAKGRLLWIDGVLFDITERKEADLELQRFKQAVESSSDAIGVADRNHNLVYVNPAFSKLYGYATAADLTAAGGVPSLFAQTEDLKSAFTTLAEGQPWQGETLHRRADGSVFPVFLRVDLIRNGNGLTIGHVASHIDITQAKEAEAALRRSNEAAQAKTEELEQTLRELRNTQSQLIQTEKMSGLGQLVAGVAHEINNPVNFIYGNLDHARTYAQDLVRLLERYREAYPNPPEDIVAEAEEIDLDFLLEDLPNILNSMQVGAERIKEIVLSLRNFSRMDEAAIKAVNLHDGIDSTLTILNHRLKARHDRPPIAVIRNYRELPLVECCPGQLNQVFMNVLANAIDALEERDAGRSTQEKNENPSEIRIETEATGDRIVVRIRDNGPGIPEPIRERLFDPFFTTKPVGKGTGLGLSIGYQIITEKHGGTITCHSKLGEGTEFEIVIPCRRSMSA